MLRYFTADLTTEFPIRERCSIVELLAAPDLPDVSIARCRVEPGVETELHSLADTQEIYVVLSGSGIMGDGRADGCRIKPLDCVLIPPDYPQKVHNDGAEDLIFLAICDKKFVPETYIPNAGEGAVPPDYSGTPKVK